MYMEPDQIHRIWEMIDRDCFVLGKCGEEFLPLLNCWIERLQCGDEQFFNCCMEYFYEFQNKSLKELTCHVEKSFLIWALLKFNSNQSRAARFLNINYKTLARKMRAYNIFVDTDTEFSKKMPGELDLALP